MKFGSTRGKPLELGGVDALLGDFADCGLSLPRDGPRLEKTGRIPTVVCAAIGVVLSAPRAIGRLVDRLKGFDGLPAEAQAVRSHARAFAAR